jgi:hypothetical protein
MQRLLTALLCIAALALVAAGCGGSDDDDGGSSADLTEFAPADAPIFVEGAIKPEGDLKSSLEAILERFPEGDTVGAKLIEELNASAKESGSETTYEDDIEPWLGERAAFYATGFDTRPSEDVIEGTETEVTEGAVIVETTDDDEAREKIAEFAAEEGPVEDAEHNGVSYVITEAKTPGEFTAAAVVEGAAILGTEQGLENSIDAQADGDNLSSQAEYASFREERGDLLISAFADVGAILDAVPATPEFTEQNREAFKKAYGSFTEQPVIFGAEVTDDQATFDFQGGTSPFLATGASELLDAGFADSWAAFAVPDIGKTFSGAFDQFASAGLPPAELNQANAQLQRQFGFTLDDLGGLGDIAAFAAGESIVDLQVGALVEIPDAGTRNRLLGAMQKAIQSSGGAKVTPLNIQGADSGFSVQVPELPVPINVAAAGDRVAIGAGPATQALISGEGGLTQSAAFEAAEEAVGDGADLSFLVEMEPIVELVQSTGEDDADFQEAKPYLEAFDLFAAGGQVDGDITTQRFVVRFSD